MESPVSRRDASAWIYRLYQLEPNDQVKLNMLNELLGLVPLALEFKPSNNHSLNCKDYFNLITSLIGHLDAVDQAMLDASINFNQLREFVLDELSRRDVYESSSVEDDVLVGLLALALSIEKLQNYKLAGEQQKPQTRLLDQLTDILFRLNTDVSCFPRAALPKCRSAQSRALCFELLIELCRLNRVNFKYLYTKLIDMHAAHRPPVNQSGFMQWDYWPRDDVRSVCGYVGLVNLGATCYMATAMQQLFMIKEARQCILNTSQVGNGKYDQMLHELKRMFAYLQESQRKAYNPREFCKVNLSFVEFIFLNKSKSFYDTKLIIN